MALVVIALAFAVMAVTLALTAGKAAAGPWKLSCLIAASQKSRPQILSDFHDVGAERQEVAAMVHDPRLAHPPHHPPDSQSLHTA